MSIHINIKFNIKTFIKSINSPAMSNHNYMACHLMALKTKLLVAKAVAGVPPKWGLVSTGVLVVGRFAAVETLVVVHRTSSLA